MLGNLRDYDVAELLLLLAEGGRGGVFEVTHPLGAFRLRLVGGNVLDVTFGKVRGDAALALLLRDPQGDFVFTPREAPVGTALAAPPSAKQTSFGQLPVAKLPGAKAPVTKLPAVNAPTVEMMIGARPLVAALLAALRVLPPPPLPFDGPAKLREHADPAALDLTLEERRALNEVQAGRALSDFAPDSPSHAAASRLARLGVLAPRKVRVARLTLGVWRGGANAAALDAQITEAWAQQLGRFGGELQLRTDAGRVMVVPAAPTPRLGARLLLSPETLLRLGLRAGESVLVRPA